MQIQLSATDNMTKPAIKKLIHSLSDAYECLTGTSEQELANELFALMNRLEDIGFDQEEVRSA
jgi:hypothetical protein